ncbi:MAG TPA: prenyltransferase/squalene oxidase repeat-containing protein [Solirubrobacteraceae bacterium]|jgi:energy-coupling factor transport system substrate-specific component|nr:prenyltransferase/squalene oxidase repeat-containing protein [Solirubrobacteraceae bacterium]
MTWQVASFAILGLGLLAGFAWYERAKPDARVVALVGTLAAFAALGRIAFAAVPNVKPTTDIVLIAGYALGGGPGFVVGAVAALTSNFFFGQGPWTPWQMAGWGMTGVLGAGLATVTKHRISRWPLALICFVVGFGFTALQDLGDWVTYSDHSLSQLGVYVGKGLGFDLVHATGCLLFALAFAPALLASLSRFRLRLDVTWLTPLLLAVCVMATVGAPARAAVSPISYLLKAQNASGGFGPSPGQLSSSMFSGWATLALAAADAERRSAVTYVERHPGSDPGSLERSILAIHAGGGSVGALLARLERHVNANGSVQGQTNLTAFAILAERAAGVAPGARSIGWLVHQQDSDGGFNFAAAGGQSDVDDTGGVLEALAGSGHHRTIRRAVRFIRRQQNRDGGFPAQPGTTSNAQSTAFAVQGLDAVGVPLARLRHSPLVYLDSLIGADGHVAYARGQNQTPVWVTAQADLALAGAPLPVAAHPPRVVPVNHKSPARRTRPAIHRSPAARTHTRRRTKPRRRHQVSRRRTNPGGQALGTDAGALTAVLLAPIGM